MHETLGDKSEEMYMILSLCVVGGQVRVNAHARMMLRLSHTLHKHMILLMNSDKHLTF